MYGQTRTDDADIRVIVIYIQWLLRTWTLIIGWSEYMTTRSSMAQWSGVQIWTVKVAGSILSLIHAPQAQFSSTSQQPCGL